MSDTFTARNGRKIECDPVRDETRVVENQNNMLENFDYLNSRDMDALREFFLHERDKELGRWRWPENPDYVVYPSEVYLTPPDAGLVTVFNERTGQASHCRRESDGSSGHFSLAARAYFAAHPEPRPWHDAKPGELWSVTVSPSTQDNVPVSEPLPMQVMLDDSGALETLFFVHWNGPDYETVDVESRHINSAVRLWPEVKP